MFKNWKKWVVLGLRILLGVLLIAASTDKILKPVDFAQMVVNYRVAVLSPDLCRWIAIWLPYVEIAVGVLLIIGLWLDAAVIINLLLMTIFTVLVTQAYMRGLDISCGCFAVDEAAPAIGIGKILENTGLTILSIILVWMTFAFHLADSLVVRLPKKPK